MRPTLLPVLRPARPLHRGHCLESLAPTSPMPPADQLRREKEVNPGHSSSSVFSPILISLLQVPCLAHRLKSNLGHHCAATYNSRHPIQTQLSTRAVSAGAAVISLDGHAVCSMSSLLFQWFLSPHVPDALSLLAGSNGPRAFFLVDIRNFPSPHEFGWQSFHCVKFLHDDHCETSP